MNSLIQNALTWAWLSIAGAEANGGTDKLGQAAAEFENSLAAQVDDLESKAGVLGAFLNTPGVNAMEHELIKKAVDAGGPALNTLCRNVIQNVFTSKRIQGAI